MLLRAFRLSMLLWVSVLAACGRGDASLPASPVIASPALSAAHTQAEIAAVTATAAAQQQAPAAASAQTAQPPSPARALSPSATRALLPTPSSTRAAQPPQASAASGDAGLPPTFTATSRPAPTSTPTANAFPCNDNPLRCTADPPAGVAAQFSANSVQFVDPNWSAQVAPAEDPVGATFTFTFRNLQVGQPFYLYRKDGCPQINRCEWQFVAVLRPQERDSAGRAIYRLTTRRDDPPGHYLVWDQLTPPGVLNSFPSGSFVLENATAINTPNPGTGNLLTRVAPPVPGKLAPPVVPIAPASTETPRQASLRARIVSPPAGATTITKELVFQVEAYDEKVGTRDGAGIDRVEMFIIDSKNRIVHKQTASRAAYCAFGGDERKCTVYDFGAHKNLWSVGAPIDGAYTLRAVVYAKSGGTSTVEAKVTIRP